MGKNKSKKEKLPSQKEGYLFYSFFGVLILLLPVIFSKSVLDITLMPRLLTLSIFLLLFSWAGLCRRCH